MLPYACIDSSHTTQPHPHTLFLPSTLDNIIFAPHCLPSSSLASTPQRQHQVQRRSTLKLVVLGCLVIRPIHSTVRIVPIIFHIPSLKANRRLHSHLLASEDQPLLRRRDTLLLLYTLLYPGDLCGVSIFLLLPSL